MVNDTPHNMSDASGQSAPVIVSPTTAHEIGDQLRHRGWTLATAESCTGGGIAFAITSVAGSSDYFQGAIVAYSNAIKEQLLNVSHNTLSSVGAVSSDCASEMARGVRDALHTDVGISSTGIAGPGGATSRKPVGLVYIAVATPDAVEVRELRLDGDRAAIMATATAKALSLAQSVIGAHAPEGENTSR